MLANCPAVCVAVEASSRQVEVELVPAVEIPTVWSKKAQWPPCLKRWPSPERVECTKVPVGRVRAHQSTDTHSLTGLGRLTANQLSKEN